MQNLHEAIKTGNLLHSLFVSQINQKDAKGNTPLCVALKAIVRIDEETDEPIVNRDYFFIANQLIQNGADVNLADAKGEMPLWLAINIANQVEEHADEDEALRLIKNLIEHDANFNYQDDKGNTGLHRAAKAENIAYKLLKCMLEDSATERLVFINAQNNEGDTPLHIAVEDRYTGPAKREILLAHGADPSIKNNKGETPEDVAKALEWNYKSIFENISQRVRNEQKEVNQNGKEEEEKISPASPRQQHSEETETATPLNKKRKIVVLEDDSDQAKNKNTTFSPK